MDLPLMALTLEKLKVNVVIDMMKAVES